MAAKKKKDTFSVTKAVKANARERVGQPKAGKVIEDRPRETTRDAKHKKKLTDLVDSRE